MADDDKEFDARMGPFDEVLPLILLLFRVPMSL